ncbi:MAG: hypothetical protein JW915_11235 [Chitinispirillaceae bacterium]|nr:hypothetical protein [Chitinispirillaceae bacterium]
MTIKIEDARMHSVPRMAEMTNKQHDSPNIRKGRFLWMDPGEQQQFIDQLKARIESGYYYSDSTLGKIADDLAPVLSESAGDF